MNDDDREDFVMNDEGLYDMWRRSRQTMRVFIRNNRAIIDEVITNTKSGAKRQHYLKYNKPREPRFTDHRRLPSWIKKPPDNN